MHVNVHQHIWTERLLDRLAARDTLPLVRRRDGFVVLHSAAEPPYVIDLAGEAPERRAHLVRSGGLDRAVSAISSPIGIEALPPDGALELIDAHLEGVAHLPGEFAAWGPVALDGADADDVDALLARDCVGISLPAGALAGPDQLERVGPVLERAADRQLPLFVHPGRAPGQPSVESSFGEPLWWPALTDYVVQMQVAWLTFASFGRRAHPRFITVFAMLAGCAPMHAERVQSRGGPALELHDPLTFYETSSYGPAAVEIMRRRVGGAQLLYGSDRPVIEPQTTGHEALLKTNGARLFAGMEAAAA